MGKTHRFLFIYILYGFSIGPTAFSSCLSGIFKPLCCWMKIITYFYEVFIQDTRTDILFQPKDICHKNIKIENLKVINTYQVTPDKFFLFLESVKFLGHQIQNNHKHPPKSKVDGFLKLQTPKKIIEIQI